MKILHAAETIKGGVATVINSLVEHQVQQANVQVICLIPSDQEDSLIQIEDLKKVNFKRNGRSFFGMMAFFVTFYKLILSEKPDVVHLHSSFSGFLGRIAILLAGRYKKIKIIYCPHAFGFLMETKPLKQKAYTSVEKILSIITDKIICVSKSEYSAAVEKGFSKEKLVLIYNGVKPKDIKNTCKLNYKKTYKILFVGRFDFQKGIDVLAEAIKDLSYCKNGINYVFTLVGESVNSTDNVKFNDSDNIKIYQLGWLKPEELQKQYLTHDVIVIPSRWEGFAMVPLEAMSFGLPIIANDISTFRELENNNDKHLILFKNKDELYEILKKINTYDLEMNRKIQDKVFNINFSEDKMKESTYKLYL